MRRYRIDITQDLRAKVSEYHAWHGDQDAQVIRNTYDADGYPFLLVRVVTEHGNRISCIDAIDMDGDVFELRHCDRTNESKMLKDFKR